MPRLWDRVTASPIGAATHLDGDGEPRWEVRDPHSAVSRIDVLPARAGRPKGVDADVVVLHNHVHLRHRQPSSNDAAHQTGLAQFCRRFC